jgi:uncharacterized protein YndB with AHSA1/START domain
MSADSPRDVRLTRTYDAPPEVVFRAWLDPEQLAAWWAPTGLDVPAESIALDPRPGGRFTYTMVDPGNGQEYPVVFDFVEISEPELIVMTSPPAPEFGLPALETRVTFEPAGDGTRVSVVQGRHTDESLADATAGWTSILDKLAAFLRG